MRQQPSASFAPSDSSERGARRLGSAVLAAFLLALPAGAQSSAPAGVERELAGIRASLDKIVELLGAQMRRAEGEVLLRRIELKTTRLLPVEERLRRVLGEIGELAAARRQLQARSKDMEERAFDAETEEAREQLAEQLRQLAFELAFLDQRHATVEEEHARLSTEQAQLAAEIEQLERELDLAGAQGGPQRRP